MKQNSMVAFQCAYCGVMNEIEVDPTDKRRVDLHEDCWVCCRPNLVHIFVDDETREMTAEAEDDM